jgi:predicted Ser/Thr protein kinase
MQPIPPLTRAQLAGLKRRPLHEGRNPAKGRVYRVDFEGRDMVVKDVAGRSWAVRRLLGPWQLDREARAYRKLAGVPGIPAFLGRPDRQAIVVEFVPGRTLAEVDRGGVAPSFFDHLERLVCDMHARDVAHGDLHHRDVIIDPSGLPHLVDFSTSLESGAASGPLRRLIFSQMRRADLRAVAKLRRRLSAEPPPALPPRPILYALGAALKRAMAVIRRSGRHT